jgi:hypothetical protein
MESTTEATKDAERVKGGARPVPSVISVCPVVPPRIPGSMRYLGLRMFLPPPLTTVSSLGRGSWSCQ